jgi:hypothetical protein
MTNDRAAIGQVLSLPMFTDIVKGNTDPQEGWLYFAIPEGGLICFQPMDDGWLIHSLAINKGTAARAAMEAMVQVEGKIVALIPLDHWPALRAAIAAGMKYNGMTDQNHILERV